MTVPQRRYTLQDSMYVPVSTPGPDYADFSDEDGAEDRDVISASQDTAGRHRSSEISRGGSAENRTVTTDNHESSRVDAQNVTSGNLASANSRTHDNNTPNFEAELLRRRRSRQGSQSRKEISQLASPRRTNSLPQLNAQNPNSVFQTESERSNKRTKVESPDLDHDILSNPTSDADSPIQLDPHQPCTNPSSQAHLQQFTSDGIFTTHGFQQLSLNNTVQQNTSQALSHRTPQPNFQQSARSSLPPSTITYPKTGRDYHFNPDQVDPNNLYVSQPFDNLDQFKGYVKAIAKNQGWKYHLRRSDRRGAQVRCNSWDPPNPHKRNSKEWLAYGCQVWISARSWAVERKGKGDNVEFNTPGRWGDGSEAARLTLLAGKHSCGTCETTGMQDPNEDEASLKARALRESNDRSRLAEMGEYEGEDSSDTFVEEAEEAQPTPKSRKRKSRAKPKPTNPESHTAEPATPSEADDEPIKIPRTGLETKEHEAEALTAVRDGSLDIRYQGLVDESIYWQRRYIPAALKGPVSNPLPRSTAEKSDQPVIHLYPNITNQNVHLQEAVAAAENEGTVNWDLFKKIATPGLLRMDRKVVKEWIDFARAPLAV